MNRSIRKSIFVDELNYIFQSCGLPDNDRSHLIPELFEDPSAKKIFLLKENIRTLKDLEDKLHGVIKQNDCILAVVKVFSVDDDLFIPSEVKEKFFGNEKQAFFVGAGISKLLKIPVWNELADLAIEYMEDKNYLNQVEFSKLKNEKYPARQIISIFHQTIKDKNEIRKFYEKNLAGQKVTENNPYELLFQVEQNLAKPIIKISTNLDLEWEKLLKDKSAKQKQEKDPNGKSLPIQHYYESSQNSDFKRSQDIVANVLYQIHGSLNDLDRAILTTAQYVENYRDENGLKGFLEKIFKECVVLFIGSAIQEFEILEHCLKSSPFKHYALIGMQTGEENLFRIKKNYFSEINIKAVPYYLDFQGYDRLQLILQTWANEILSSKSKQFYEKNKLIEEVL